MTSLEQNFIESIKSIRQRQIQAIGAGLSRRDWWAVEKAYNELCDRMDRLVLVAASPTMMEQLPVVKFNIGDPGDECADS